MRRTGFHKVDRPGGHGMNSARKHAFEFHGFGSFLWWGLVACWLAVWVMPGCAAEPVVLREVLPAGTSTQVRIELKAEGLFRPGLPPSAMSEEARMPKPLALDVKTRLIFRERLLVGPNDLEDGRRQSCTVFGQIEIESASRKGSQMGCSGSFGNQR